MALQQPLETTDGESRLPRLSIDPYEDQEHRDWDEEILEYFKLGPTVLMGLAMQNYKLNRKYEKLDKAKELWHSNPQLRKEVAEAFNNGTLRDIRILRLLQEDDGIDSDETIKSGRDRLLNDIKGKMKDFIVAQSDVASRWIPMVPSGEAVDLLLDQVGERSDPAKEGTKKMVETVAGMFQKGHHSFIYNTSGSGKTRHVFEGLCHNWGFYFVCAHDHKYAHGSEDLNIVIEKTLPQQRTFKPIPEDGLGKMGVLRNNRKIANHCFKRVWLARMAVFEFFINVLIELGISDKSKSQGNQRTWLLLQATPSRILGIDIFRKLTDVFMNAHDDFVAALLSDLESKVEDFCGATSPFAVIDEAQHALGYHRNAFLCGEGVRPRPVLREIVADWIDRAHLVICGSGLSKGTLIDATASGISKYELGWSYVTELSSFDDPLGQREYILHYIRPHLEPSERQNLSPSVEAMLNRAWRWLRGRYRFTASYVTLLLCFKLRSPHRVLDEYIKHISKFEPTDSVDLVKNEDKLGEVDLVKIGAAERLQFRRLDDPENGLLKQRIFWIMMKNRSRSEDVHVMDAEFRKAVEYGFARIFKGKGDKTMDVVRIDEPLVLLAASAWYNFNDKIWPELLKNDLWAPTSGNHGLVMEQFLAFYFLRCLNGETPLDQIVRFVSQPLPTWAKEKPRLVARVGRDANHTWRTYACGTNKGSTPVFGFTSKCPKDTLDWLNHNQEGSPFCFPDQHCGPDILFLVELGGTYVWVAVQVKCICSSLSEHKTIKAVKTLTPNKMYTCSVKTKDGKGKEDVDYKPNMNLRPDLLSALCLQPPSGQTTTRPNSQAQTSQAPKDSVTGGFQLLRIVSSFPAPVDEKHIQVAYRQLPDHPLAILDTERLEKTTGFLPAPQVFIDAKIGAKEDES